MDGYYRKIQDKLLIQKDMIDNLLKTQHPRVRSDYYEAILRDLVRESVPKSFSVGRGIILDNDGRHSEECDLILYDSSSFDTWFQSGEIVVVTPEAVRCIIEIKRTLTSDHIVDAIQNLKSANNLRKGIFKFIAGFYTSALYSELVSQCIYSKTVNGMFIFSSKKREDEDKINVQMKNFIEIIKIITKPAAINSCDAGDFFYHEVNGDVFNADSFEAK